MIFQDIKATPSEPGPYDMRRDGRLYTFTRQGPGTHPRWDLYVWDETEYRYEEMLATVRPTNLSGALVMAYLRPSYVDAQRTEAPRMMLAPNEPDQVFELVMAWLEDLDAGRAPRKVW